MRGIGYSAVVIGLLAGSGFGIPAAVARPLAAEPDTADADSDKASEIVVTASRSGQGVDKKLIGSSVTVVDAQQISERETRVVSDVLRDVPGVAVSRTGAVGGMTSVRIRGSEANHVLVFVDGIKASDPYQGEFDWATLIADDAARVEVLRGQQSSLYGSDAIGGVINYITLSGREAPGIRLRGEGGSMGTYDGTARIAGVAGKSFDYAVSGSYFHTDGYPTAPGGSRDVGSDNAAGSAKVDITPSDNLRFNGVLRYSYTRAETNDQSIGSTSPTVNGRKINTVVDTPDSYYQNGAWYGLLGAELTSFDGLLTTSLSGQFADTYRDAYASFGYSYGDKGTRYRGSFVNTLHFGTDKVKHLLTFAIDAEREEFRNVDPSGFADTSKHVLNSTGFVGEYDLTIDERFALGGSVRYDDNDFFDDDTTWHVEASYLFPSGTRPHAAAGSGVKNPSSFELFGYSTGQYIGNPDLKPEESTGWEIGIDQSFASGAATIGFTYFNSTLTDEIYTDYLPPSYTGTSLNRTTETKQQGVEIYGNAKLGDVRIDASYTYLDAPQFRNVLLNPTDPNSFASGPLETQAVRRPNSIASLNLTYAPKWIPFSGTLTVRYNGEMKDVVYDQNFSAMFADLKAFTLVNLALRYDVAKSIQLYVRAENLFDEKYQEVFTFNTPGQAFYAGVRARF